MTSTDRVFKNSFFNILLTSVVTLLFTSCSKEDRKTNTELLTAGPWKIVHHQQISIGDLSPSVLHYEDCAADNTYTFRSDGIYFIDDNILKCNPNSPQYFIYNWGFSDNEKKIMLNGNLWNVDSLTSNRMVLSAFMFRTTTVTITYVR